MFRRILSLSLIVSLAATAAPLSEKGRQRLTENLHVVDSNLRDTRENLGVTRKNLKTIEAELKELDTLEKEHLAIKKKYEAYLEGTRLELKKNDELGRSPESATARGSERQKWKEDTLAHAAKVEGLYFNLLKNLRDVRARRGPLQGQLDTWTQREKSYTSLIGELEAKKSRLEALAETELSAGTSKDTGKSRSSRNRSTDSTSSRSSRMSRTDSSTD